jgi:hypothetical protein
MPFSTICSTTCFSRSGLACAYSSPARPKRWISLLPLWSAGKFWMPSSAASATP